MKSLEISVVMTNRNDDAWIERSIRSVLSNEFRDFELIVVDDGSDDDSRLIIGKLAGEDSRIVPVFLEKNVGISAARNIGIQKSSGKYIALLDSDDCHLPSTLGTMHAVFQEALKLIPDMVLLVSDAYLINERDRPCGRYMSRSWHGLLTLDGQELKSGTSLPVDVCGLRPALMPSPRWCLPSTWFFDKSTPVSFCEIFKVFDAPAFMARMEEQGRIAYAGIPSIQYRMKMRSITNLHGETALRSMDAVALSQREGRLHDPVSPDEVPPPCPQRLGAWTHGRNAKAAWCNQRYGKALFEYSLAFASNPRDVFKRAWNFFASRC